MTRFYSRSTGNCYLSSVHASMPPDAVPISEDRYQQVIESPAPGKERSHDADGLPILVDPAPFIPSASDLCRAIDHAADAARIAVVGAPLRDEEYKLAAAEAQAFKEAGYPADNIPRTVAAWAINGRTPLQAADNILREAEQYNEALYCIRETRLQARELIRAAIDAGNIEQAKDIADETVASIKAAVAGIGNNAGV